MLQACLASIREYAAESREAQAQWEDAYERMAQVRRARTRAP